MSGVLVVPGIFGPGSAVELYHAEHEATLRPGADSEKVGEPRLVDENGNVGWDGLDIGELYLVVGYVDGWYCVLRNRATDGESPQIAQQPAQEVPQTVGTQRDPVVEPPPEPPENAEELETGIAPGAQDSMPLGSEGEALYIYTGSDSAADSEEWHLSDQQTPAETAADGSEKEPQALYCYRGADPSTIDQGNWQRYEGAHEDVPAAEEPASEPPAEPPADPAPVDESNPTAPETAPASADDVPSADAPDAGSVGDSSSQADGDAEPAADAPPASEPTAQPALGAAVSSAPSADVAPAEQVPAAVDQQEAPAEPAPAATVEGGGPIEGASTSTTVLPEQVGETPVDPSAPPASPAEGADQVAP